MTTSDAPAQNETLFENPFQMEDLMIFDDHTLHTMLTRSEFGLTVESLADSLHDIQGPLLKRIQRNLSPQQRPLFLQELHRSLSQHEVKRSRRHVLDGLFWELTYWKTPELYEELTEGEHLHPGIFERLQLDLQGKTVLDAGAGSGRASLECIRYGAKQVYAVEPSPGLLHILEQKLGHRASARQVIPLPGRFDALPLDDNSVDLTLSCSAFTAAPEQGGEPGLTEMIRVTREGGKIVLIWPRREDHDWLRSHGFRYVALPLQQEMRIRFRSLKSALECARRFYARNKAVAQYILNRHKPEIPFSVLGVNPPNDYCWLEVTKTDTR
ncbi:MAG: class I SAM-dependent methyltransferase [Ktedonobacteraceae bacterium]|nr:class I SAM-dependent methyltransferase [Ktedonobacteraceae bacterium]